MPNKDIGKGFNFSDVVFSASTLRDTIGTPGGVRKPDNLGSGAEFNASALRDAIKSMEGVRKPIQQIRVVKSEFVPQGLPTLLVHPDDFEFIKNAKLI